MRGDVERLVQDVGKIVDIFDQPIMLRAGARDADRVAFLKCVRADQVRRDLPGQHNDRDGIEQRIGQRRDHVRRPRPGRDQHDAGLAG